MKKKILAAGIFCLLISKEIFPQFAAPPTLNSGTQVTGGLVGIGTNAPATQLDVMSNGSQLRLSNTSSVYSEISTTSSGHLIFAPNTGKIGFGPSTPIAGNGFHSNMGRFLITDPVSATTRGIIFQPNQSAGGDIPIGSSLSSAITSSGEGFAIVPCAYGYAGVKLGAYAFTGSAWKSMWETQNVSFGIPNLLLVKNGGNVGIGTSAPRGKLDVNGKVIIGTTTQTGTHSDAMLTVDGKTVAKEMIVTMQNWADYVFEKDYKLPNLHDVEKYYLTNKHLPEIPSEKEVIENGVSVGEMNKLLLKKIEELTLYVVKQQKEIEKLKERDR